jgi:hypothetical protein
MQPPAVSEDSYFSQYADVQPALDNDDPSEDTAEVGETSLNGNVFANLLQQHTRERERRDDGGDGHEFHEAIAMSHPRPSSASSGSEAVTKLEKEAESQSVSEIAIKQHIATSIKSLYRLAKTTGMAREEFQSLIRTETELLSLSDDD